MGSGAQDEIQTKVCHAQDHLFLLLIEVAHAIPTLLYRDGQCQHYLQKLCNGLFIARCQIA